MRGDSWVSEGLEYLKRKASAQHPLNQPPVIFIDTLIEEFNWNILI